MQIYDQHTPLLAADPGPKRRPADVAASLVADHDDAWLDAFTAEIDGLRARRVLSRVLSAWGLTQTDFAELFRVSRQAVSAWVSEGVPVQRAAAIADLSAATDLLVRYLKRDRIPAVVRRPAPALGGRSLVDLVGAGQTREALDACRAMFDVAGLNR